jgi:hypothetical protein
MRPLFSLVPTLSPCNPLAECPRDGPGHVRYCRWLGVLVLSLVATVKSSETLAETISAFDTGTNYGSGTFIGQNGGSGFDSWLRIPNSSGTQSSDAQAQEAAGTFLLTSGTTAAPIAISVDRSFSGGSLAVGATCSILEFLTQTGSTAGAAGITLFLDGTNNAALSWNGTGWTWNLPNGTGGGVSSLTDLALSRVDFTRTGLNSYSLTLTSASGSDSFSGSFGQTTAGIDSVVISANHGYSVDFTTLQVVPEPSTYAMLIVGGLTAVGAAVRRRRRQAASAL